MKPGCRYYRVDSENNFFNLVPKPSTLKKYFGPKFQFPHRIFFWLGFYDVFDIFFFYSFSNFFLQKKKNNSKNKLKKKQCQKQRKTLAKKKPYGGGGEDFMGELDLTRSFKFSFQKQFVLVKQPLCHDQNQDDSNMNRTKKGSLVSAVGMRNNKRSSIKCFFSKTIFVFVERNNGIFEKVTYLFIFYRSFVQT